MELSYETYIKDTESALEELKQSKIAPFAQRAKVIAIRDDVGRVINNLLDKIEAIEAENKYDLMHRNSLLDIRDDLERLYSRADRHFNNIEKDLKVNYTYTGAN